MGTPQFNIENFWVDSFEFKPTDEPTKTGQQFLMNASSEANYNKENKTDFRLSLTIELHRDKKFIFKACQMAIIRFEKGMSEEEAANAIPKTAAAQLLYPYLRAFMLANLKLAGHDSVNIPILMLE